LTIGRKEGLIVALLFVALAVIWRDRPLHQAAAVSVILAATVLPGDAGGTASAVRSFFGVLRVQETAEADLRFLVHGTTVHGAQRIKDSHGQPVAQPVPASYYHAAGPMARSLALL